MDEELERIRKKKLLEMMRRIEEKRKPKVVEIKKIAEIMEESKSRLVLVDFYADWCMPCKYLSPILERLAEEGNFLLAKLNIDGSPEEAASMRVEGVPTVVFFRNRREVFRFVGVRDPGFIRAAIRRFA